MNENIKNISNNCQRLQQQNFFLVTLPLFLFQFWESASRKKFLWLSAVKKNISRKFFVFKQSRRASFEGSFRMSISLVTTQNRRFSFSCLTARTFSAHRVLCVIFFRCSRYYGGNNKKLNAILSSFLVENQCLVRIKKKTSTITLKIVLNTMNDKFQIETN